MKRISPEEVVAAAGNAPAQDVAVEDAVAEDAAVDASQMVVLCECLRDTRIRRLESSYTAEDACIKISPVVEDSDSTGFGLQL